MENRRNYYRILHVQPDAPLEVIKSSYRTLMHRLKQHPDLGGDHWNATLINEAYSVLRNPNKRDEYDVALKQQYSEESLATEEVSEPEIVADECPEECEEPVCEVVEEAPKPPESPSLIEQFCWFCKTPHGFHHELSPDALCIECNSPLFRPQLESLEHYRRNLSRLPRTGPVSFFTFWPGTAYPGRMNDLSPTGLSFITPVPLNKGQVIKIETEAFHATGKVTYQKEQGANQTPTYLVGIEFLSVTFMNRRGNFIEVRI